MTEYQEGLVFAAQALEAASPGRSWVKLWGVDDIEQLKAIDGVKLRATMHATDGGFYVIDSAEWTCGRVEFTAQRSRPATKDDVE